MITTIISELQAEKAAGDALAQQLIDRVDAHIRDLEVLKAWIADSFLARSTAIDGMLGVDTPKPAEAAVAPSLPQDEAA